MLSRLLPFALFFSTAAFAQVGAFTGSTTVIGPTITQVEAASPQTFQCVSYPSLQACLDAAKAYVNTNEAGAGHAANILLDDTTYTLAAPYALVSGMQLHGVYPRVVNNGQAPDDNMVPNGGTWINCAGLTNCFTGTSEYGVVLERLGFENATGFAMTFGGNNINGMAQSIIRDVDIAGSSTVGASAGGLELINPAHVQIDRLKVNGVNQCLHIAGQSSATYFGNLVISDYYCKTYVKSAATNSANLNVYGTLLETLTPSSGTALNLQIIHFIRPQFTTSGDSTAAGDVQLNTVQAVQMDDVDVEGQVKIGIDIAGTSYTNRINFGYSQGTAGIPVLVQFESPSSSNSVFSLTYCSAANGMTPADYVDKNGVNLIQCYDNTTNAVYSNQSETFRIWFAQGTNPHFVQFYDATGADSLAGRDTSNTTKWKFDSNGVGTVMNRFYTPALLSNAATNTDLDGELALSNATTATYTFLKSYTSHPEVTLQCQFNCNTNTPWVTYTGVTSFTINFATAVTGTVSYGVLGRN